MRKSKQFFWLVHRFHNIRNTIVTELSNIFSFFSISSQEPRVGCGMSGQQNADPVPGPQIPEPGGVSAIPGSRNYET